MKEELQMMKPESSPFFIGLSTLCSFVIIGFVPLFAYVIASFGHLSVQTLFPLSIGLTGLGFVFI